MNQYLIPANSKKSRLIVGFFTPRDLVVAGIGAALTLVLLVSFNNPPFWLLLLSIMPLSIAAIMLFPIPNYHNVMQLLLNIFDYAARRKKYFWKGWCVKDDANE